MHNLVRNFWKIISQLYGDNVVLTGSSCLIAHGLKMSRKPNDLDLLIYNPTLKQKEFLKAISIFDCIQKSIAEKVIENEDLDYFIRDNKIMKFKLDGHTLDIHLSDKDVPFDCCMFINVNDIYFKIQSINEIVKAKNSYSLNKIRKETGLRFYMRRKDSFDLNDLKNLNFNIEEPTKS